MRHNGRPALVASALNPGQLDLREGWRPLVACPDCGCWATLRRGMLLAHRNFDALEHVRSISGGKLVPARRRDWDGPRCAGSGQRFHIDLTVGEWQSLLEEAIRDAAQRCGTRAVPKPRPPVSPAVHQLAAARQTPAGKEA